MEKQITLTEARQMAMVGLSTEGYRIVDRSLEARLIDALRQNTAFVTHWGYDLLVNLVSDKSATVFSGKDRQEYQVTFEPDNNDEPRIIKITPIGRLEPNQEVIREQVTTRIGLGLPVTEKQLGELKTFHEQEEKSSAQKLE